MQGCDKNASINVQQCNDLTPVHKKVRNKLKNIFNLGVYDYYNDTEKKIEDFHWKLTDASMKVEKETYSVLLRSVFLGIPSGLSWKYIGTTLPDGFLERVEDLEELSEFAEFERLSEDDKISNPTCTIEEKDLLEKLNFNNYITYDCYVINGESHFGPTGKPLFSSARMNTIVGFHIKQQSKDYYKDIESEDHSVANEEAEGLCKISYEVRDDKAHSCSYDPVEHKCYAKSECELNSSQLEIQGKRALVKEFTSEYIGITLNNLNGIVLSPPFPFTDSDEKTVAIAFAFEDLDKENQDKLLSATNEKSQEYPISNGIFIALDVPFEKLSRIEPVEPPVWELMPSVANVSVLTSYDPKRVTERQSRSQLLKILESAADKQQIVIDSNDWNSWDFKTTMENTFVTSDDGKMYRTKPIQLTPWPLLHVSNVIKALRGRNRDKPETRILFPENMVDFWEILHDTRVDVSFKQIQIDAQKAVSDILYRAQQRVIDLAIIDGNDWEFTSSKNRDPGGRDLTKHLKHHAFLLKNLKKTYGHISDEILYKCGRPSGFVFERGDYINETYIYAEPEKAGYWRPIGSVTEEPNNGNDTEYSKCKEQLQTIITKGTLVVDVDGDQVEVKLDPGENAENFIIRVYDLMWNALGAASSGKDSEFTKNTNMQNTRRWREALSVLPKALNLITKDELNTQEELDVDKVVEPNLHQELVVAGAPSAPPPPPPVVKPVKHDPLITKPLDLPSDEATSDLKTFPIELTKTHMDSLGLEFVRKSQDANGNAVFEYKSKPPHAPITPNSATVSETSGVKSAEEYMFAQPPPGVIIPSMSSETHVTIKPRENGLADVIVARPRSKEPTATQVRSTKEHGEYECAMRFVDRKYKCWDKMSDIASVTLTTYRWIARNVIEFYKLHDKTSLVIYHASNTPNVFPPNDESHVVLVGAVETARELAKKLHSDQTAILVKTVCGANDKMPCVDASCTLSNTECVQCKHNTFCGADESVLLALVVWACERRPTPMKVELRGIPKRLYKLAKWLCDISTPRADVMNFENGVRAQLHIQRFIESVPLCLSSTTQQGMCYWFDPKPSSSVSQWMNDSNLSYVAPRKADPHETFIKDWMKVTLVSDILSPKGLTPCSDPELLKEIRCVLKKIKTLHQRIIDKRADAETFLKTQKLISPARFEQIKQSENPRTEQEKTVYNVYLLVDLYTKVSIEQVCEHLDDTDLAILMRAVGDKSIVTELEHGERLSLVEIEKFLPQKIAAASK